MKFANFLAAHARAMPERDALVGDGRRLSFGQPVNTGEAGDVWVRSGQPGSYSTMRGYFQRPEEAAQTLHNGWVATGDMGRFARAQRDLGARV